MLRLLQVLPDSGSGSDRNQQIQMHRLRRIRSSELPLRRMRIQVLYLVLSSGSEGMVLMCLLWSDMHRIPYRLHRPFLPSLHHSTGTG